MKSLFFAFLFVLSASVTFGQDCRLIVTNMTGSELIVGAQLTEETPNNCPVTITGSTDQFIPIDATSEIIMLGTVAPGDPIISPYIIGASYSGGGSASWTTNPCWGWNSACSTNSGPLNIVVTSCGNYDTEVTIYP